MSAQSKVKGEARIEKRSRIEGEARTEGEAREKAGEGSGAPPQKFFEKSNLKLFILVHIILKQLFEMSQMTNEIV